MMTVLIILATWRLTGLLVYEEGPFSCFYRLRRLAGIIHDKDKSPAGDNGSFLAGLLKCFDCTSVWVSALLVVVFSPSPLLWLAGSAGAMIIERALWQEQ